ncbi:hypothetical protein Pedsa_1975 [Pseudopedobacter saltans DSM 12145]|uniref:Uncharacterized protein n=1 Tax=Pseudopedobacter saltans (strain ATCC 51119 / DSM 12145 / JCM 21818 / CCUG 39354 / LMG 10337 / NBRC 100064 / NCIMB 13643) TaxID=762903 RepID=F0S9X0_PSESL|nr:hypothetical protein Pedsa_1975 [Pseudopedobacter saltans DSM 12145]
MRKGKKQLSIEEDNTNKKISFESISERDFLKNFLFKSYNSGYFSGLNSLII